MRFARSEHAAAGIRRDGCSADLVEDLMRVAAVIVLLSEERAQVMQWARSKTVSVRLARRAQIVLGAADGLDNETIAAQLGLGRVQVGRWRTRYAAGG